MKRLLLILIYSEIIVTSVIGLGILVNICLGQKVHLMPLILSPAVVLVAIGISGIIDAFLSKK